MADKKITPPEEAGIGLDLFAAAWLERWNSYGGTVTVSPDGRVMAGSFLEEPNLDHNDPNSDWKTAAFTGATRELLDLARLVPGGKAAIAAHVARFPKGQDHGVLFA